MIVNRGSGASASPLEAVAMAEEPFDTPYRGGFVGREHRFALTVYFEDTDTAGVVYYANYLKFMERARSDMLRAVGIDQRQVLEAGDGAYYVSEANIRYVRSARLGDDLVVTSTVEQVRAASVVIQQRVIRAGELLTDAQVTAAFLDANGRPQRQPKEWTDKFKQIAASGQ
jgi:acyl-CoA thioester hydrolase